jgi:hypothetical protein
MNSRFFTPCAFAVTLALIAEATPGQEAEGTGSI